jgi:Tfp pilus assembly protein PilF
MSIPARFIATLLLVFILFQTDGVRLSAQTVSRTEKNSSTQQVSSERAAALVSEGVEQLAKGDVATAKNIFRKALELNPRDETADTYLGVIADRENDLVEAEKYFAAAAQIAPHSAATHNNYGAILQRRGRTAEAASQFEIAISLNPQGRSALINLAQIYSARETTKDFRLARNLFMRASALGLDVQLARALVVVNLHLGDTEAARAAYRDYAAQIATNPNPEAAAANLRAELGEALLEGKLFDEAIAELNTALIAEPTNVETIVRLARAYLAQKNIRAAGRTLESAVARGVDAAPVYALLAEVYETSGHIENAIPAMRLAIRRDPQSESYRFRYGLLLTNALAPAAAVIRLEEALKIFPNSPRLWFALGMAQFKQSKNDDAVKAFTRALDLDPKFAPALAYLGLTYEELGQYDEALKFYDQALGVDDQMAVANYLAGSALLKQNTADPTRLENYLARAIKLDPAYAEARLALAKLYMRSNRFEEAATELERVRKLSPDLAETYYQLGRVYGRLKRQAEAQEALATFKRLSETQKEQEQNEKRDVLRRLANVRF